MPGLTATPARAPAARMSRATMRGLRAASTWKVTLPAPASANPGAQRSGSSIIRWQSAGISIRRQQALHHRQPEGQVGDEVVVHHVEVDPVGRQPAPGAPRRRGRRGRRSGRSARSACPRRQPSGRRSATSRRTARNIASVPCRCGHSWTRRARRRSRSPRAAAGGRPPARRRRGRGARRTPRTRSRPGAASTSRRRRPRPGGPRRRAARSRSRCVAPERGEVGRRAPPARLRAAGAGRPRPVQGASTSTRSNGASPHGALPGVAGRGPRRSTRARSERSTRSARWACCSTADESPARSCASPSSRAALPPGPAHTSSHSPASPSTSARASARATSWLPSSWTPARPSRTHGEHVRACRRRGCRPAATTGPARPRAASSSSSTVIRPGRATSEGRAGALSAASRSASSPRRAPRASRNGPDDPGRMRPAGGQPLDVVVGPVAAQPLGPAVGVAAGDLAQHGVDEARPRVGTRLRARGRARARTTSRRPRGRAPASRSSWWAPSRSTSCERRLDLRPRPGHAGGEDRVVPARPAQGAVGRARWRTRRRARSARSRAGSAAATRLA